MSRYSVRIAPSALDDINDIADFYFDMVDAESSKKFIDDVLDTIVKLNVLPERNVYFDKEYNLRRALVKNHNVSVVYVVDNGIYEVVAFGAFHASEQPNKYTKELLERLSELG